MGHERTLEMLPRLTRDTPKPIERHHLVVAGPRGMSSAKSVPTDADRRVISPPNCFESALTIRVPSPRLRQAH